MEMKINSKLVKSEREKRAWSQEHLASVSGLGIRTIQRIENNGSASLESLKALASTLEIEIADLRLEAPHKVSTQPFVKKVSLGLVAGFSAVVLVTILIFSKASLAEGVILEFDVSHEYKIEDEDIAISEATGRQLISDGETSEIDIYKLFRIEVTPLIQQDGKIQLLLKVFQNIDEEYLLIAEPRVMTGDKQKATIEVSTDIGGPIRMLLTPSIGN